MAKGVKGKSLKGALARELAAQSEKDRRAAYEKRQLELQKQSAAGGASKKQSAKGKAVQQARQRQAIQPYRDGEAVLLVGEGNFSFARAYAKRFPRSAKVSVATSYDSEEEAKEKYSDLEAILADLEESGMTVLFDVDAQKLEKTKVLKKRSDNESFRFDKVVFNFPHVGLGEKDEQRNIKLNQILLLRFLKSVKPFLKAGDAAPAAGSAKRGRRDVGGGSKRRKAGNDEEDEASDLEKLRSDPETDEDDIAAEDDTNQPGSVLLTVFTCKPYNEWAIPSLAKSGSRIGPSVLPFPESRESATSQPKYKVVRSFDFIKAEWEGYEHRRTVGHRDGKTSLLDREHAGARTWELQLAPEREKEDDVKRGE